MENLPFTHMKILEDMNILKGNINLINEMMDGYKYKNDFKKNDLIAYQFKALRELEPKLQERI